MNKLPNSMEKVSPELQRAYVELKQRYLRELHNSIDCPVSDQKYPSIKTPVSSKKDEIYVQFKPNLKRNALKVELHVDVNNLQDSRSLCLPVNNSYPHWSYFEIGNSEELESLMDYYFGLIKQSHSFVSSKSKDSSNRFTSNKKVFTAPRSCSRCGREDREAILGAAVVMENGRPLTPGRALIYCRDCMKTEYGQYLVPLKRLLDVVWADLFTYVKEGYLNTDVIDVTLGNEVRKRLVSSL